jgi:hypothetical protein
MAVSAAGLTFGAPITTGSGAAHVQPNTAATGDVNSDGILDVVANKSTLNGSIAIMLGHDDGSGNGDGTFTVSNYDIGSGDIYSLKLADVDNDGKLDIIVANNGGQTVRVAQGNGDGTFGAAAVYSILQKCCAH